jgi:ATP-dependent helicase/nuclease subunit B
MGEDETKLLELNEIREKFVTQVSKIKGARKDKACVYVDALYDFLVENQVQEKLKILEDAFSEKGDLTRAKEYAQIYRLIMELLDQVHGLLDQEEITREEFLDILFQSKVDISADTMTKCLCACYIPNWNSLSAEAREKKVHSITHAINKSQIAIFKSFV